jgi:hypothetical protein
MKWLYHSENVPGNFHSAVGWINAHHPDWDVVTMQYVMNADYTVVVWREPAK